MRMRTFIKQAKRRLKRGPSLREWVTFGLGALAAVFVMQIIATTQKDVMTPLAPQSPTITIAWLPEGVRRWSEPIERMAARYNIDPNLIAIIMTIESGGRPDAKSPVGAEGLMQVMPGTAGDIARKHLKNPVDQYTILDPETNIEFGTAYLAYLRNEFGNQTHAPTWNETAELIAAGYNGGPGAANNLEQGKGMRSSETVMYSRDVYNMWRERHAETSPTYERWLERGGQRLINAADK
jgi:soluble lytic murein transglycosylase-like protein